MRKILLSALLIAGSATVAEVIPPDWNANAEWFMYAPSFAFREVTGAVKYRFRVLDDCHVTREFVAVKPSDSLAPVWEKLPKGFVTVSCFALDAKDVVIGFSGERTFWKNAPFKEGTYPKAKRSYDDAVKKGLAYLLDCPSNRYFLEKGKPDPSYDLNCYPAKMHSATVEAMCDYMKLELPRKDEALKLARLSADYLIAIAEPEGRPLAGWPHTYEGKNNTAARYAGQQMLVYPAKAGNAFLSLFVATKDARYLAAAKRIAATYLKLQGEDGTWYLKLYEKDGRPVNVNRLMPNGVIDFLERLHDLTGDESYRTAADRAFAYVDNGPLKTWNWEGQFEDVPPSEPYYNLTKHFACDTAIYLLKRFPTDAHRQQQAAEILRWSEDQFIAWETPARKDGIGYRNRPGFKARWTSGWQTRYSIWHCPAVMEQYSWYQPIDASAAKLIRTYLAYYKTTGDKLALAKARVLGDAAVNNQRENGLSPTGWFGNYDEYHNWINCHIATIAALQELCASEAVELKFPNEVEFSPREGTSCERGSDGAILVENNGTYGWPGVRIRPRDGRLWNLSKVGVVEVTVSNRCETAETIHAVVLCRGVGLDRAPAATSLFPPHSVRTISIQIADDPWVVDEPVKLEGMQGRIRAKGDLFDFGATTSIDVYQTQQGRLHKSKFAVLDVRTAFEARRPTVLPATDFFPFVDRYGQFKHGEWVGKIHSDEELQRVRAQEEKWLAEHAEGPVADVDQYGGWLKGPQLKATGFFRTEKVGDKWWLVDPEGHVFFSLGIDCFYPGNSTVIDGERKNWFAWLPKAGAPDCDGRWFDRESNHLVFNFIEANLVRKYGKQWKPFFHETAYRRFKAWGVNTFGNWSNPNRCSQGRISYVATVADSSATVLPTKDKPIGAPVPDVYSEQFAKDIRAKLELLRQRMGEDPWCVGVFVDNELAWGEVANAGEVAERYYSSVKEAMREILPNHLYLGSRFHRGDDAVWRAAARHCDVVSFNFYERHPSKDLPPGSVDKPIIVGEFHFGAKDRGQFAGGCSTTFDQAERAAAFTRYVNDCLDNPRFVGCHWFQYQDQPLTGRPDGENYNDGFVSVCDIPYPELVDACRKTAAQIYPRKHGERSLSQPR